VRHSRITSLACTKTKYAVVRAHWKPIGQIRGFGCSTRIEFLKWQTLTLLVAWVKSSVITAKAANDYHFKTGQRRGAGTASFLHCNLPFKQVQFLRICDCASPIL
jgi:hypothetical protein